MEKLLKRLLAVTLAFQTSLTCISTTVYAEDPEEEPEYTAETITEEEETVLTEENEEENIIVLEQEEEEPGETAVPELEEEPEESEAPEVTEPEETAGPEITEEPEEPETPEVTEQEEEPEETELPEALEPEEEPEETDEPVPAEEGLEETEVIGEYTGLEDAGLMSEPIGAHELYEDTSLLQIQNAVQVNNEQITVTAVWKVLSPATVYLIAENSTTRYFLDQYEMPGTNVPFKFENITPGLPEGQYTLRAAVNDASFEKPTLSVSPAYSKKLQVLPAPDVSVSKQDNGYNTGALQVKLPDMTYIDKLVYDSNIFSDIQISKSELTGNAVKGVYTISNLPEDWYAFRYTGISTSDMIVISGGDKYISIPRTRMPVAMDAWAEKKGHSYGTPSDPLIMEYKGETVKISAALYPADTADDTRLTYKSNNTKVVTVDTVGNIKAVGNGETSITVSSQADPSVKAEVYVKVEQITPKTFKFNTTKAVPDFGVSPVIRRSYTQLEFTLLLTTDSIPSGAQIPVTFTVTGGDGLKIFNGEPSGSGWPSAASDFKNYVTSFTRNLTLIGGEPRAQIHLMAVGGGHYTVTAEALGKKAVCTIDVDGFTSVKGTEADPNEGAQFYKAGKLATGWITYMDEKFVYGAAGIKTDSTGLAGRWIYYVDPSTKKTVNEGVYKIGGKLYCFGYDRRVILEPEIFMSTSE